ncbi:MAG: hypothetical protein ACLP0J_17990 [Solirubrobacteraceae bacterium]
MIERALIHVAGPARSGKTVFIEAMLNAGDALIIAARCVRDDTLRHLRETTPASHPELRRYREAGAIGAALLTFPGDADLSDSFFTTNLMRDYSEAVVLEGDSPLRSVDLRVFVAPPPAEGHQLFVRCTHRRERDARGSTAALEQLLGEPDRMVDVLGVVGGARLAELGREHPEVLEKMRTRLGGVAQARRAPLPDERWAIADSYAGIEHAQLVVVNACKDCQRRAAEQLVADIVRLRKDNDLRADILGPRGSRIPITAVVANLVDPDDPARKKALARVRRAIRSASS